MHKKVTGCIVGLGLLALAGTAQAVDVHGMVKGGFDFGGDKLATAEFESGNTSSIRANEGLFFGGGVALLNADKSITTEITLSWKEGIINASNGDITFMRYPVDVLVFYNMEKVRFGGGATYHLNPKLRATGAGKVYASDTD